MKLWKLLFILSLTSYSQTLLQKNVEQFIGLDVFENFYYIQNNTLHKSNLKNDYQNIKYGTPNVIDISNPLQVLLLYKFFNKVVLLDNQLSYITEFDVPFGTELIANAGKDKIWIYDNIDKLIKLFNFQSQKIEIKSIPIPQKIIQLKGNLNHVNALTNQHQLIKYNYLAKQQEVIDAKQMILSNSLIKKYFIKNNVLYLKNNKTITTPNNIQSFDLTDKKLYFFKDNNIYTLAIPKN